MTRRREHIGVAAESRRMVVGGCELAYEDSGHGTPVVCLHAVGHGGGDFVPLRQRLGDDAFRWVVLDWPGQGRSDVDTEPASARRYADLLTQFLARLDLDRPILLGNSIGGAAAIRYAAQVPGGVRALVLANPGGLGAVDRSARAACAWLSAFFRAGVRRARWFPRAFAWYYRQILQQPAAQAQRQRIVDAGYELAPVLAQAWASFAAREADLRALAPTIACPVLFTWAKDDRIISYARSRAGIAAFPNHRVVNFRAGHAAFLEQPDEFAREFRTFVETLPAATARRVIAAGRRG